MFGFLTKVFGTAQGRLLKRYRQTVAKVNAEYEKLSSISDEELREKTAYFRKKVQEGTSLDELLPEAFACVKEACRRLCGTEVDVSGYSQRWDMIPFDVQIVGGITMHHGNVAEMQTGEGKTLTASMPLYLNALTGRPVHLVTVNDYLAQRDCDWIGPIFEKLGLSFGTVVSGTPTEERREIYQRDVIYGTASEFGFDYLRDNSMALRATDQVQSDHYFAIVDEVDSILIDEARTPLIISGPSGESRQMYGELKDACGALVKRQRDLCNRIAREAKAAIDELGVFPEDGGGFQQPKGKADQERFQGAMRRLWILSKGVPNHRALKRLREHPDFRDQLDRLEVYFHSDQNKKERLALLGELYIIVDERSSEYELTDRGTQTWQELFGGDGEEFTMIDLGEEYRQIDENDALAASEKLEKKVEVREKDASRKERAHNLSQLFRAHLLMEKDVDYIIQENKVVIIDENTGRPQPGRRFSDGLHQAIEAKEGVDIQQETQTYATITLQNYFRMYDKVAGMSGTATTESGEFKEIYKMDVVEIPTYRPCQRKDEQDRVYMTEREKYHAILEEVKRTHEKGRPILIGTESVEVSEKLSRIFKQHKIPHTILNARHHEQEAAIISEAGRKSAVTISTNMAGRGTDIKLGEGVAELGGLHVIGTTRHQSRRIDRQLRGRCARLGDPGSSVFFVSFEDSLMRLFASPKLNSLLQRLRPPEGEVISSPLLTRSIEVAQKRIEQRNYSYRKHTLEYDDVMNKHRQEIYAFRNEILHSASVRGMCNEILGDLIRQRMQQYLVDPTRDDQWDIEGLRTWLMEFFPVRFESSAFDQDVRNAEKLDEFIYQRVKRALQEKLDRECEKICFLEMQREGAVLEEAQIRATQAVEGALARLLVYKLDRLWQEHLLTMDHLRTEVNLRTVGQKDPLMEFKQEAFDSFMHLNEQLSSEMTKDLFSFSVIPQNANWFQEMVQQVKMEKDRSLVGELEGEEPQVENVSSVQPPVVSDPNQAGRNEPCPCGSGKKYKKCCGVAQVEVD